MSIKKVVILAGGRGTRLSEITEEIPKPLVTVGGTPAIVHIMRQFYKYGYKEFIIALGFKSNLFKSFFRDYMFYNRDVTVGPGQFKIDGDGSVEDWTVHLVETGENSSTGLRINNVRNYIGDDDFFLTYGDSFSNVNIRGIEKTHFSSDKVATITAVPQKERFGILSVDGEGTVTNFSEKSRSHTEYINGGFIACSNNLLDYVNEDSGDFSFEVLSTLANERKLGYHTEEGVFWKAMDTKKDKDELEELYVSNPELFAKQKLK